jgi:hypothetical protein
MTRATSILFVAAVLAAGDVSAQVVEAPPRPVRGVFGGGRPPDPTRTRQELFTQFTLLGGFDDNLSDGEGAGSFQPRESGYMGYGDAAVRYFVGRDVRSFDVNTRGFMNTYRNAGVGPSYGGDLTASGRANLGRSSNITASQTVRYSPYFTLGTFGALRGELGAANPDANPTNAVNERDRSWVLDSSAQFHHDWTRGLGMDAGYSLSRTTYVRGLAFDSLTHSVSLGAGQEIGRSGSIRGAYRRSDSDHDQQDGGTIPLINDTIDVGFAYQHDLSPTRRFSYAFGSGGIRVETLDSATRTPIEYWSPSGYATLRLDFGRSWNVSADYRRAVSVLQGLTPESFISDTGTLRAGGFLGSRVEAVVIAGYVNGQAGNGLEGRYDGYTGTGQLRFLLTRWWAGLVSFNHYQYRLNTVASESLRVPAEMHRNAIRVGLSWSVPLVGSL